MTFSNRSGINLLTNWKHYDFFNYYIHGALSCGTNNQNFPVSLAFYYAIQREKVFLILWTDYAFREIVVMEEIRKAGFIRHVYTFLLHR